MIIRRYQKQDVPTLLQMLKKAIPESRYAGVPIDDKMVVDTLMGNVNNSQYFCNVIEADNGELVGILLASVVRYPFSRYVFASDQITYIDPEHRNLKAITELVGSYVEWGKERGVMEVRWSQSTAEKTESFKKLAERLGFKHIGAHFTMEL